LVITSSAGKGASAGPQRDRAPDGGHQIQRRRGATDEAHQRDGAAHAGGGDRSHQVGAAHHVEHHVHSTAASGGQQGPGPVALGIDDVGPQSPQLLDPGTAPYHREHARTGGQRQLENEQREPTAPLHGQGIARAE
jgi:hypothetical protein